MDVAEESFFYEHGYHLELVERMPWLTDLDPERFRRLLFGLVKPDAVAAGKARAIVRYLERHRFRCAAATTVLSPRAVQFEELYKFNLTLANARNQLGSWWLNSQTYMMGPSIALLLVDESDSETDLGADRLTAVKGPSDPYKGQPGQLRHDLRASNQTVNLLHTADGPWSAVREAELFLGADQLERAVRNACDGTRAEEGEVMRLAAMVDVAYQVTTRDFSFLRAFGVLTLRTGAACDACKLARSTSLTSHMSAVSMALELPGEDADAELARVLVRGVPDVAEPDCCPRCRSLYLMTRGIKRRTDVSAGFELALREGISLSAWGELVIRSTFHYPDNWEGMISRIERSRD